MQKNFNIAVLIDGDNAQPKLLQNILEEVAKYGKATIRRIYGDWTTTGMKGWKEVINLHSFNPIQKFSYTSGKNSTDSSLIIDAMDILHAKNVDGFCIVSSDSDYTGLAKRIREQGIFVMGIGQRQTPVAFIQSCEIFTFTENITAPMNPASASNTDSSAAPHAPARKTKRKSGKPSKPDSKYLIIDKAFEISAGEDDEVFISQMGLNLRKIDPSFDTRGFGYKTLTELFENLPHYEVIRREVKGTQQSLIKRRPTII